MNAQNHNTKQIQTNKDPEIQHTKTININTKTHYNNNPNKTKSGHKTHNNTQT